jgi:hypothetical protein
MCVSLVVALLASTMREAYVSQSQLDAEALSGLGEYARDGKVLLVLWLLFGWW